MRDRLLMILIMASVVFITAPAVVADVPTLIGYQGVITDSEGEPITGVHNVTFTIYDAPTVGNDVWTETQTVTFDDNGRFDVLLGEIGGITDDVFDDPVRWLAVQMQGDEEMIPRTRIVSTAYAHRISTIDGAGGGIISGDVTIQSDLDVDGDIRVTGKATIGAGHVNTGAYAFVAGETNTASADYATVGGGLQNTASFTYATVAGGVNNAATGEWSTVAGGVEDTASGSRSMVGGGVGNTASGQYSIVGGGYHNSAIGIAGTVAGGQADTASGSHSVVGGGQNNTASGGYATVPGGYGNEAAGDYSFAAGRRAKANHNGAFVWADQTDADLASTGNDQFLIRASGGVGIGTSSPNSALEVAGTIHSTSGGLKFPDGSLQTSAAIIGFVPVGAVIAWLRTFLNTPSLPTEFAECNGQTVDDAESPYNGQTLPNLNASGGGTKRSLRGSTSSGATGGTETHYHTVDIGSFNSGGPSHTWFGAGGFPTSFVADYRHTHSVNPPPKDSDTKNQLPPYYEVVWVMRIK